MQAIAKKVEKRAVTVMMDGVPLEVPQHLLSSAVAIRSYLEMLALKKGNVLFALSVDGESIDLDVGMKERKDFQKILAMTIPMSELRQLLMGKAISQIKALQARVQSAAAFVLINNWTAIQTIINDLLPDLRAPLFIINFVAEIGPDKQEKSVPLLPLREHMHQLSLIIEEIEHCLQQKDTWLMSDILEQKLNCWLQRLLTFLSA
jgi:hypothetical protein